MNLALRGIDADLGEKSADSFTQDLHPDLRADFVMANPPFNVSDWWDEKLADDPRWNTARRPEGNANFAWVQHFVYHLSPPARRVRARQGSLSSKSGGEGEIRRSLSRPTSSTASSPCPTSFSSTRASRSAYWLVSRDAPVTHRRRARKDERLFIDARKLGIMVNRRLRELKRTTSSKWLAHTTHA